MEDQIQDFITTIRSKGYRGRFQVCENEFSNRKHEQSYLENCLKTEIERMTRDNKDETTFVLATSLYSPNIKENLEIRLIIHCSIYKGLSIQRVRVNPDNHEDRKVFTLQNNHELPGSNAIEGYYPKKNLWDDHMRGQFRNRH